MPDIPEEARKPFQILVTGSRTSKDWETVWRELHETIDDARTKGYTSFEVRHGCAQGPDTFAADFCEDQAGWYDNAGLSLYEDRHPVDWNTCKGPRCKPAHRKGRRDGSTYCPRAALDRDDEMVAKGAHVCLSFIDLCALVNCPKLVPHGSHGASYTADQAERAGIFTRRFPEDRRA